MYTDDQIPNMQVRLELQILQNHKFWNNPSYILDHGGDIILSISCVKCIW